MATNTFLVFDENNANILNDATYSSDTQRASGLITGTARSNLFNKAMRQSSIMAAALGEIIKNNDMNASDSSLSTLVTQLQTVLNNNSAAGMQFDITLVGGTSGWTNNTQTVNSQYAVTSGYAYTVAPAPSSVEAYASAGVYAVDITTNGQITFNCKTMPSSNLTVRIFRMITV